MRRIFNWYQYLGPIILGPLSYWLWFLHYDGNHKMVAYVVSLPIIYAYIVPAVGTNVLKVWEFDTRIRLGNFRPHHGFVFGSATAIMSLPFILFSPQEMIATGLVLGSTLGVINWYYDIQAIRSGFIRVYNQPYANGLDAKAIVSDYAPFFFGMFGFFYGICIRFAEQNIEPNLGWDSVSLMVMASLSVVIACPVISYMAYSQIRYGHLGCRPLGRVNNEN